jgi:AmiR/NasT family two-component response regulator
MTRHRILIVDDEIIIARELEARLQSMGYDVVDIASSGHEAIRIAMEMQPDLILMDIVLKGEIDGIEAATEIRRRIQVPIIYLTAYTDGTTVERARATEPSGYIVKPFSESELNASIEIALSAYRAEK